MEVQRTQTAARRADFCSFNQPANSKDSDSQLTQQRLNTLLAANAEIAREKTSFRTERERFEIELMKSPLATEKALAYFGAMLGLFPPFALFSRFVFAKFSQPGFTDDFWIIPLLLFRMRLQVMPQLGELYTKQLIPLKPGFR